MADVLNPVAALPNLPAHVVPGLARDLLQRQAAIAALPAPTMPTIAAPMQAATPTPLPALAGPNVAPSQTIADTNELHRIQQTGSGVSQIANPFLRGIARVADVASAFVAPRLNAAIPGTMLHHQVDLQRQQGIVGADQQADQAAATLANTQAQEEQRRQLAGLEIAKAQKALASVDEPTPGKLVLSGDGSAAGYQDGKGNILPLNDPSVPDGVRAVAANMAGKPANVPTAEKPIGAEEATARNALWDALAKKHGLPTGQFSPTMSRAEANALAGNLGTVVGKQQGDTHITVQVAGQQQAQNRFDQNNGTSFDPAALQGVANGSIKFNELFGRGATTQQKAAALAQIKAINPSFNSGDHDLENQVRKDFTSGKDATTLTNINTADSHIAQLRQIASALHNGNVQLVNRLGNAYATATGQAAPLNFQLLKTALAAEIGKTTSGGVATIEETKELSKAINDAGSPEQILGVTDNAHHLMASKRENLHNQYRAGLKGEANFTPSSESTNKAWNAKTGRYE